MKRSTLTLSMSAIVALAALAACTSDTSTSPGTGSTAEMQANSRQNAGQGASLTLSQLDAGAAMAGANVVSLGGAAVAMPTTVNCTGPAAVTGWYTCVADNERGLVVVRQIRFWEGTHLGIWWNPGVTDSINHAWTADGTVDPAETQGNKVITVADSARGNLTILRAPAGGTAVVTPPQHSWTGAGAVHHSATWTGDNNVVRTFTQTGSDSVNAVLFQMPRDQNPYPLSGSITLNFNEHFTAGDFTHNRTQRFVVTFNGTHIAQLQDGGLICDLDLDAPHAVTNCH